MSFVKDLDPPILWKHFDAILAIPHGSKNESGICDLVVAAADRHGLSYKTDPTGNVVVRKPPTPGRENAPITVLQAHLDMVNEKNADVEHDFDRDPIIPRQEGGYVKAAGTTLGADNGIGVAAMLALMETTDAVHGPLELLFTVDEETGLTGAAGLTSDMLAGRLLLNLDSEDEGELTVGCAGGADSQLTLPLASVPWPGGSEALTVKLAGLKGGHSGGDIHLQRGNACKLLNRALYGVSLEIPFHLAAFQGGDKSNAIPREAAVTVAVAGARSESFRRALEGQLTAIRDEYQPGEPKMTWEIAATAAPERVWDEATTDRVTSLLGALPHGVVAMSFEIPDLVETSTNLARVTTAAGELGILLSSRSSVASALTALRHRIRATASLAGAQVDEHSIYPGWKPNMDSPLLAVVKRVTERVLGTPPKVAAVHAGLECGLIGEKFPGMDMISFGPTIQFAHSPDERVKIDTVGRFYRLLLAILEELA